MVVRTGPKHHPCQAPSPASGYVGMSILVEEHGTCSILFSAVFCPCRLRVPGHSGRGEGDVCAFGAPQSRKLIVPLSVRPEQDLLEVLTLAIIQ